MPNKSDIIWDDEVAATGPKMSDIQWDDESPEKPGLIKRIKGSKFAKDWQEGSTDIVEGAVGAAEAGASLIGGAVSFVPSLITAGGELTKGLMAKGYLDESDSDRARKAQEQVMGALTYQPKTEAGQKITEFAASPFTAWSDASATAAKMLDLPESAGRLAGDVALVAGPAAVKGAKTISRKVADKVVDRNVAIPVDESLTDIRSKIAENKQTGKPVFEGISPEEIQRFESEAAKLTPEAFTKSEMTIDPKTVVSDISIEAMAEAYRKGDIETVNKSMSSLKPGVEPYEVRQNVRAEIRNQELRELTDKLTEQPKELAKPDPKDIVWDEKPVKVEMKPEPVIKEPAAAASSSGFADVGGYASGAKRPAAMELPEIVELGRDIMGGKYPSVKEKLRIMGGRALGVFYPGKESIKLKADIFAEPGLAEKVLAHEIGHVIDWLPDKTLSRGNLLGRIASLKKHMKSLLEEYPQESGVHNIWSRLTQKERDRIKRQVAKESEGKPIEGDVSLKPEDVVKIWTDVNAFAKDRSLHDYVAGLDARRKAELLKSVIKGIIPDWVDFTRSYEQAGKFRKDLYLQRIKEEILKRRLYEAEVVNAELKALTQAWKPFNENANAAFTKYRYSGKELYADALSVLINDPAMLKEKAPTFFRAFMEYAERKPEMKSAYEAIQGRSKTDILLERDRNIEDMFQRGEDKYADQYRQDKLTIQKVLQSLKYELVDKNSAMIAKYKALKKRGINLPPERNPVYWLEELPYISAEIAQTLKDINQSVLEPLKAAGMSDIELGKYMFLKRVSTERSKMANPLGHTKDTAITQLEAMRKTLGAERFASLEVAEQAFRDIRQKTMDVVEKSELFDDNLMKVMRNSENYATFDVQHYIETRYGRNIGAKIYQQIGTLNEITNPFTATVMKDAALIRAANRKKAAESTVTMLKDYFPDDIVSADTRWNGKYREPVDAKDPSKGMIAFTHKGKVEAYYVDKYIAKSFTKDPYEAGVILKTFSALSRPIKEILVTKNPFFMIWNLQRDIRSTGINIPEANLLKAIKYEFKAIPDAFRDVFRDESTPTVREMYKNRSLIVGRQWTAQDISGTKQIDRLMESYNITPKQYEKSVLKPFRELWEWMDKPGQFSERLTKIAGYKLLKDIGGRSEKEISHIIRTRIGSPDFQRAGALQMLYNNVFLFSNAGKEGLRASFESYQANRSVYAWKQMKYNILPKLVTYGATLGLLGKGIQDLYNGIPDRDKTNYMTIPLGQTKTGKTTYFVMPHDFTGQLIAGTLWQSLNQFRDGHLSEVADYMAGGVPYSGLHPLLGTTVDAIQYMTGRNPYDSWRGDLAIRDQVFEAGGMRSHKEMAKYIANNLGVAAIVYRFKSDDLDKVKSEIEEISGYPLAGQLMNRFLRVSDRGIREQLEASKSEVRKQSAEDSLNAKDALVKMINGEKLSHDDILALAKKPKVVEGNIKAMIVRKHGGAFLEAYMSARTNEEKLAVLNRMNQMKK